MIAAVDARKSTEQNVLDDAKSVTRQVELARAFAASKGWRVADEHVYIDDAVAGAEYVKRPTYQRLMAALDPTPPFGALVVMEQSRLGVIPVASCWPSKHWKRPASQSGAIRAAAAASASRMRVARSTPRCSASWTRCTGGRPVAEAGRSVVRRPRRGT